MPQGTITLPFGGSGSGGSGGGGYTVTRSPIITIPSDGPTYTIPQAVSTVAIERNGLPYSNFTFNSSTHTWTFNDPLYAGEQLVFIYNK